MEKPTNSSNVESWPLKDSQIDSRRSKRSAKSVPQSSRQPSTRQKRETGRTPAPSSEAKNRNRRNDLLRKLKIDIAFLNSQPQISPLLKQCGILPARVIEVLRADIDPLSLIVVSLWDELTPANRSLLGLEGLAVAAGTTPRRLWELYNGANMIQSRESIGAMIADALPSIMRVTIKDAKKAKGFASREHIYKAARVLPTPKGSVINIGVPNNQPELESGEPQDENFRELQGADDFLMRASRAMMAKQLTASSEPSEEDVIDAEENEEM